MSDSSPRRRFQFGLRTLFVIVTAVAIVCGVVSVLIQQWVSGKQEHFVQVTISGFGGTWTSESARNYQLTGRRPSWRRKLFVNHIAEIDLSQEAWPKVERAAAGKPFPVFRDEDLIIMQGAARLLALDLSGAALTDNSLPYLQRLRSLRKLDLTDTGLSQEAIEELRAALPDCKIQY